MLSNVHDLAKTKNSNNWCNFTFPNGNSLRKKQSWTVVLNHFSIQLKRLFPFKPWRCITIVKTFDDKIDGLSNRNQSRTKKLETFFSIAWRLGFNACLSLCFEAIDEVAPSKRISTNTRFLWWKYKNLKCLKLYVIKSYLKRYQLQQKMFKFWSLSASSASICSPLIQMWSQLKRTGPISMLKTMPRPLGSIISW